MPKFKKILTKPKNNKSITDYLKRTNNASTIEPAEYLEAVIAEKTQTETFYHGSLLKKTASCGPEKNCHEAKNELEKKLFSLNQKLEQTQRAYSVCLEICGKKEKKIEELQNEINLDVAISKPQSVKKSKKVLFQNIKILSNENLSTLRSIAKTGRADSTFILNSVRFLYSKDLTKLQKKSIKGRDEKEPISPIKYKQLKSLYEERLDDLELNHDEKTTRGKKFERHLHRAIMNINTGLKNESVKKKVIIADES